MDTSSVPLASRSDRPLIVVAPRNFLSAKTSGIKEWFERGGSVFLCQTCSPSFSLSRFVSRVFQGMIVSPKTIILFLVVSRGEGRGDVHPLFTVHISKELEASSFQLNRLPITCYYSAIMYIRDTGTETKLLQKREGGGDVIDSLAGALRNDFSKPRNVF